MVFQCLTLLWEGYLLFLRGLIFAPILCYNKPKGKKNPEYFINQQWSNHAREYIKPRATN